MMATAATTAAGSWWGQGGTAMMAAAVPKSEWQIEAGGHAAKAGCLIGEAAAAHSTAVAATIPYPVVIANRIREATLQATNIIGQNTPAIAEADVEYGEYSGAERDGNDGLRHRRGWHRRRAQCSAAATDGDRSQSRRVGRRHRPAWGLKGFRPGSKRPCKDSAPRCRPLVRPSRPRLRRRCRRPPARHGAIRAPRQAMRAPQVLRSWVSPVVAIYSGPASR